MSSFLRNEKKSFLSQKAGIILSSKSFLIFGDSSTRFLINWFLIKTNNLYYLSAQILNIYNHYVPLVHGFMGNKCKLDPKSLISNKWKNTASGQTKLTYWQNKFKTDKEKSDQTMSLI